MADKRRTMWYYGYMPGKGLKPTLKQRRFVAEYIKTGNATEAAWRTYNNKSRRNARLLARANLQKPIVKKTLEEELEQAGLTIGTTLDVVKGAMFAGLKEKPKNSDSLRAAELLLKLYNAFPASKSMKLSYNINQQTPDKNLEEIRKNLSQLNEKTSSLLSRASKNTDEKQ